MKTMYRFTLTALLLCLIQNNSLAQVGSPAPDFTVTDVYGNTHHLYEYLQAGKKVVLDFFFTTCGPCQYYAPQVNLAYEKYGCNTREVVFIAIDYDDTNAEVEAYDETYNIEYPSVSGLQGGGNGVVSAYNVSAFPTFYLLDSTLTIIDEIEPPTLVVFDFRFAMHGIEPADCLPSSIGEITASGHFTVYPNPAGPENPILDLTGFAADRVLVSIYDIGGRLMADLEFDNRTPARHVLPLNGLLPGFYMVGVISTGSVSGVAKMVVR